MDIDVQRVRELLDQREQIDAELVALVGTIPVKARKPLTCSKCGSDQHNARTCPQKEG